MSWKFSWLDITDGKDLCITPYIWWFIMHAEWLIMNALYCCNSLWIYTAISRNAGKMLHKPIPKGSMGRRIELLHVLNTNEYNNKISANFSFLSFQTCRNKVRLAPLKFRRIFLTQRHATVKVKLHIRGKTNSPRAKIQTCKLPLGQYAKFQWIPRPPFGLVMCTLMLFSDNLSRNRCML